jgi:hypothetical protein
MMTVRKSTLPSSLPAQLPGLDAGRAPGFSTNSREILPPTIFFFAGFNLIVLTTNLILAGYLVAFGNFMLATAAALVVGKAVLVTNAMPFLRHYDRAPLIQPILFKTVVYWAVVFVARLLEHFVRFWLIEHNPSSIICSVTASFGASSSPTGGPKLQLNRRQRIRELVRLSRLADAHSVDEFRDPTNVAHTQLIDIVCRLARGPQSTTLHRLQE